MVFRVILYFFALLGCIFFLLLAGAAYVWFADPWNIRPVLDGMRTPTGSVGKPSGEKVITSTSSAMQPGAEAGAPEETPADEHPLLSSAQEEALGDVGVDVSTLPTAITPAMEACFTEKLGEARVEEIKSGSTPTPLEVARTLPCVGQ